MNDFNLWLSDFVLWAKIGIEHITDWQGADHLLFIVITAGFYSLSDWKKSLWLSLAFTLGHSITLVLSTYHLISLPTTLIEVLIPITILLAVVLRIFETTNILHTSQRYLFATIMLFGCIHGMGFSNMLKSMLGKEMNILNSLLAFNIGLEFGQILILSFVIILGHLVQNILNYSRSIWNWSIIVLVGISSLYLLFDRIMMVI
jgi:ABC-type antimicrobial peptide transport system permease subunit